MRLLLALLVIAPLCGCREWVETRTPKSLMELAAGWSGGRTDPTCRKRGPRGEYLGTIAGAEYCEWPTVVRGPEWSTVSAHRDSVFGVISIAWDRRFRSGADALQLADSLSKEFLAQGLSERKCPQGGRRWEGENLSVEFHVYPKLGDLSVVTVFAATNLAPSVLCPAGTVPKPINEVS